VRILVLCAVILLTLLWNWSLLARLCTSRQLLRLGAGTLRFARARRYACLLKLHISSSSHWLAPPNSSAQVSAMTAAWILSSNSFLWHLVLNSAETAAPQRWSYSPAEFLQYLSMPVQLGSQSLRSYTASEAVLHVLPVGVSESGLLH